MRAMKRTLRAAAGLLALALAAGCASTPIVLNAPPKGAVDMAKGRTVRGNGCGFQLLLLLPLAVNGRQERAYQELMGQARDDYVTDFKVEESWWYAFVGTVYCTQLEATAYPYVSAAR